MEKKEEINGGNITGLDFDYNKVSHIPIRCGRLDQE